MTATEKKMLAKGSVLRATLDYVRSTGGDTAATRVLSAVPKSVRQAVQRAAPTDEVDYSLVLRLWTAADAELSPKDPEWMERAGAESIGRRGAEMYGGILRKKDPLEFLTQSVSLFRLYYHPGDMHVVQHEDGRAVLRLVGFDPGSTLFCRRQTGGLTKALELADGIDPMTRHVRCALEGDAFCEWEMSWRVDGSGLA